MNIVPREPFEDLGGFFREDDWFFPVFSQKKIFEPEMNVYETKDNIVAELNIPDIDCKDVRVFMDDGVLKVSGKFEEEEKEKDKNYWKKEIRKGSFQRAVRMPTDVDEEKIDADYRKGILKITLPKVKEKKRKGREIKVRTNRDE